jgi:hypothetical protein
MKDAATRSAPAEPPMKKARFSSGSSERKAWAFAGAVFGALTLVGCQRFGEERQCRAVARIVNPVLATIDDERRKNPMSAPAHRDIAKRYMALASALPTASLSDLPFRNALEGYREVFREASHDAQMFSAALDSADPRRIAAVRGSANRTVKRESALTVEWDSVCLPR